MRTALALVLLGVALASARVTMFERNVVPRGWTKGAVAPADAHVSFIMALKQRNLGALERIFWSAADPKSDQYQQWMSIEEIQAIVAPEKAHHKACMDFVRSAEPLKVKDYKDAIEATVTVAAARALFGTEFYTYTFTETGRTAIKAWGLTSLPADIAALVDFVEGINTFPLPHLSVHVGGSDDDYAAIPQTFTTLYNIANSVNGESTQTLGVIEFEGESYAPSDLQAFATDTDITIAPIPKARTVGPNDPSQPGIESTLDIEIIASVNPVDETWFWLEAGDGWLFQFVNHFFSTKTVPSVASISYAWSEMDQCEIDPNECQKLGVQSEGYVKRCNTEFQKIGLRGVSLMSASGDSGANGRTDPTCTLSILKPDYPACSPYLTSVGATQLNNPVFNLQNPPSAICQEFQCLSGGDEVAVSYDVSSFASGGGFSWYSPRPSWQEAAVQAYFNSGVQLPPASYYNNTNRGYPDIAAIGHDCIIYQGGLEAVGGTSCATPIFASVISALNAASVAAGKSTLGPLGPFLYQMASDCPDCFQDITVGDNFCTEDGCSSSCEGYYATKGWDPVTGLGSPNEANMVAYIQNGMKPLRK